MTTQPLAASADRLGVQYFFPETAYGTFEVSSDYKTMRLTGESLGQNTTVVSSQEIRSDRQNVDVIRTGVDAGGDINFELSYASYDDFFQAALQAAASIPAKTAIASADATVAAADADNSFTHATAWDGSYDASTQNASWIKVSGFATAVNNGYFKIVGTGSGTTKIIVVGATLITEAVGPSITIDEGGQIVNGTAFNTFSIQKHFNELADEAEFERLISMAVNTMSLTLPVDGVITGSFGMIGNLAQSSTTDIDSTPTVANTNETMASVEDVAKIFEGLSAYGSNGLSLTLNNNLRPRGEIATLGAVGVGSGTLELTGTLQAYYATDAVMAKYLAFTSSSLAVAFQDSAGNSYVIDIPEIKYTDGKRVAGGRNTDILADMTWQAKMDPTESITIKIVKW